MVPRPMGAGPTSVAPVKSDRYGPPPVGCRRKAPPRLDHAACGVRTRRDLSSTTPSDHRQPTLAPNPGALCLDTPVRIGRLSVQGLKSAALTGPAARPGYPDDAENGTPMRADRIVGHRCKP